MLRRFTPAATFALSLVSLASPAFADTGGHPTVEVMFVLDTTGSMGGLIEGAKQKIWSIVNDIGRAPSHPHVRVGLVAYRDHGDVYVTKVLPITSDLDKVYATLTGFQAEGGGDTPEDVRQALADGVNKAGWSPGGSGLAKILFLVGDAPPHDDYTDEPDTLTTAAEAARDGIIVNAIECGNAADTRVSWQAISRGGSGEYFDIEEDGGVRTTPTPYDKPIATLGASLGATYMAYGGGFGAGGFSYRRAKESEHAKVEGSITLAAPAATAADRAVNNAINSDAYDGDLMQSIENGRVTLDTVKPEDLPDNLKKLSPQARRREIQKRLTVRQQTRAQILALSKKRDAFLAAAEKTQAARGKPAAFDVAVATALKKQLSAKGIRL